MMTADTLLGALQDLRAAATKLPQSLSADRIELPAVEGARVLAAANLIKAMTPKLEDSGLSPADAAKGLTLLAADFHRHLAHCGEGRGQDHPLHPQLEALRAAWRGLAEAAEGLRNAPASERQDAILHATLSWRRAHAEVQRAQTGI